MVNHPLMAFLHWTDEASRALQALDVHLELGILPDLLGDADHASLNAHPHLPGVAARLRRRPRPRAPPGDPAPPSRPGCTTSRPTSAPTAPPPS